MYDSYTLLASIVQEMLRKSLIPPGMVFLGITVTISSFQIDGQILVVVMELKMMLTGKARRSL